MICLMFSMLPPKAEIFCRQHTILCVLSFYIQNEHKTRLPMQKDFTLSKQVGAEPLVLHEPMGGYSRLQPRKETLQRIMQFAAAYRAEKVDEKFTDIMLN